MAAAVETRVVLDNIADLLDGHRDLRRYRLHRALVFAVRETHNDTALSREIGLNVAAIGGVARDTVKEEHGQLGFGDGVCGDDEGGSILTAEGRVFVGLTYCENECSVQSVTAQIPMAIEQIRNIVKNDSRFSDGYHFVGHSQGGGIARAVVENMDDHKVHSLVSLAGMQNGMFYGPQAEDVVPLFIMVNVLGPQLLTPDIFDFSSYTAADWRGKFQHDLAQLDANQTLQAKYSLMNMNREPADNYFIANNKYLPYLNNLNHCDDDDFRCKFDKIRPLAIAATHSRGSIDEIATKFEEFTVMDMEDTVEYKSDTYGLRTLDERGDLHRTVVANISHNCWIVDGVRQRRVLLGACVESW
ncbi:Palmitoyl protein thioesterase [Phytophthora infestans]|uniref:Palmitoyl protein thioesterase n=1 Tax=Phytophthora infestans TaxID=4787 RepID=A0A8S9ULB4_PHYIN|nr:Palmitoyl protein thioesterase [Phytophthora infestans]